MGYHFERVQTPNFGYPDGRHGTNDPEFIVIHHWGVDGQDFDNVVNWLCNPKAGVSAHYVVEGGRVTKLLSTNDAGWHAGDKWYNEHSIGIECRPEMSNKDLNTVIELVANIWNKYGKMEIIGHKDIVATSCPGRYYKKLEYIEKEATKLYNEKQKPAKLKVDGEIGPSTVKSLQYFLKKNKYYNGPVSGKAGINTKKGLQKFLNHELHG